MRLPGVISAAAPRYYTGQDPLPPVARSLRLDACGLDDRPPFLDFGLVEGRERFWRLLLGRRNVQSEFGEFCAHGWLREDLRHRATELEDDVPWRAPRREKAEPPRDV